MKSAEHRNWNRVIKLSQTVILVAENTSHVVTCEISAASRGQITLFHIGSDLVLRQPHIASCFGRAGALSHDECSARKGWTSEEWPFPQELVVLTWRTEDSHSLGLSWRWDTL